MNGFKINSLEQNRALKMVADISNHTHGNTSSLVFHTYKEMMSHDVYVVAYHESVDNTLYLANGHMVQEIVLCGGDVASYNHHEDALVDWFQIQYPHDFVELIWD